MPEPARLLDVAATPVYLGGICADSVRALVAQGQLVPVRLPSCRRPGESSRRLLFAREDLDALIDQWKRASTAAPNAQLSKAALEGWKRSPVRKNRLVGDAPRDGLAAAPNGRSR